MNEYRQGVGIILINTKAQVFVAKRVDSNHQGWQMPQGGIDAGEQPLQAAMRELLEEIGTNDVELLASSKNSYKYEIPYRLITGYWQGKYIGQEQKWFLMRFKGEDHSINIQTIEPEFSSWKWIDPLELPLNVVAFKKQLYIDLLIEFLPLISDIKARTV